MNEIANVALFLASNESSAMTGANLLVDGGLTVAFVAPSRFTTVSDLPPPVTVRDDRFAAPSTMISTAELLFRIRRLLIAMTITAVVLALLPVPAFVPVVVLLAVPMLVLVVAISHNNVQRRHFFWRYARTIWEYRRDAEYLAEAGERAREPVRHGLRRAWLLLGLFVAIFMVGLVLAGLSAGAGEVIYG